MINLVARHFSFYIISSRFTVVISYTETNIINTTINAPNISAIMPAEKKTKDPHYLSHVNLD